MIRKLLVLAVLALGAPLAAADDTAAELKAFWRTLSMTVNTGDFDGYAALYHPDAVLVTGAPYNKDGVAISMPIAKALAGWKPGFEATKAGKLDANVGFRFTTSALSDTTAHQTGIFYYFSVDEETTKRSDFYVHFDALLVKKDGKWLMMLENQIRPATREDYMAVPR